jgi:hypothetical protein
VGVEGVRDDSDGSGDSGVTVGWFAAVFFDVTVPLYPPSTDCMLLSLTVRKCKRLRYKDSAWGKDELNPVSKQSHQVPNNYGSLPAASAKAAAPARTDSSAPPPPAVCAHGAHQKLPQTNLPPLGFIYPWGFFLPKTAANRPPSPSSGSLSA